MPEDSIAQLAAFASDLMLRQQRPISIARTDLLSAFNLPDNTLDAYGKVRFQRECQFRGLLVSYNLFATGDPNDELFFLTAQAFLPKMYPRVRPPRSQETAA